MSHLNKVTKNTPGSLLKNLRFSFASSNLGVGNLSLVELRLDRHDAQIPIPRT